MQRVQFQLITRRLREPRKFIQIIEGPRQVGKTTLIKQVIQSIDMPVMHFSADNIPVSQATWISSCWQSARSRMKNENLDEMILVIDEIQRLYQWAEVIKKEWDSDTFNDVNIKVLLLGSSRMRLERGQSESLKGRFEVIKLPNWSWSVMVE